MDISYGAPGLFGGLIIGALIILGLIGLVFFVSAANRARKKVVADEGDEPDLLG